jgi:hypothetical protein
MANILLYYAAVQSLLAFGNTGIILSICVPKGKTEALEKINLSSYKHSYG